MENSSSSHSSLPPNFVTIKDLQERWLKRRQDQQQQHLEKDQQLQDDRNELKEEKYEKKQEPGSRPGSQSPHADRRDKGERNDPSAHVQAGPPAGKVGRIGWQPPVRMSGPSGRRGDGELESGRWWSHKEGTGNARVVEAVVSHGADIQQPEEASGGSGLLGKSVRDQPASEGRSLVVENVEEATGAGGKAPDEVVGEGDVTMMLAEVINGAADVLQKKVTRHCGSSRKGAGRDSSSSKRYSRVVENGEMVTGDGQEPKEAVREVASSKKGGRANNKGKVAVNREMTSEDGQEPKGAVGEGAPSKKDGRDGEMASADGKTPEGAVEEGASSKKGGRGCPSSKNKGNVVKYGEMTSGDRHVPKGDLSKKSGRDGEMVSGVGQAPESAVGECATLKKGGRRRYLSKNRSKVVENGKMAGDGKLQEGAAGGGALPKNAGRDGERASGDWEAPAGNVGECGPSKKGGRGLPSSKNKGKAVENEEMASMDGQALEGAAGDGALSKEDGRGHPQSKKNKGKVVEKWVAVAAEDGEALPEGPAGKGVTDESGSKNMAKENQAVGRDFVGEDRKDEIVFKSIPEKNGLQVSGSGELVPQEEAIAKSATAIPRNGKKYRRKDKSMATEVEDSQRARDVVRVNSTVEIEGRFRDISMEDSDRKEGGHRPISRGNGRYSNDHRRRSYGGREVRNQNRGEHVWVKKGETVTGDGSQCSSSSTEFQRY